MKTTKLISVFSVICFFLSACSGGKEKKWEITSFDDLDGKTIGVTSGTIEERLVKEKFPKAKIAYFLDFIDIVLAMEAGKVDAMLECNIWIHCMLAETPGLTYFPEPIRSFDMAMVINKDKSQLTAQVEAIVDSLRKEGVLEDMEGRWFREDATYEEVDIEMLTTGEPLVVASLSTNIPTTFIAGNGKLTGFDVELTRRIGLALNRPVKFMDMSFDAIIPAVVGGKVDIGIAGFLATPERRESVNMVSYTKATSYVLYMGSHPTASENPGLWSRFKTGIHKNLIVEDRYMMVLNGLGVTLEISLFAILLGTMLGALLCFCKMSDKKLLRVTVDVYSLVMKGTPVVVLLMVVFYIVFANVGINPIVVAVFAFGLNSSAYFAEIIRNGLHSVGRGQVEAAYALGFNTYQTFWLIRFPQAVKHALPVYENEIVTMIKNTAIVGYIAIADLTKAGDIIRSRTFDAFFPLILVTILYLVVTVGVAQLLRLLANRRR